MIACGLASTDLVAMLSAEVLTATGNRNLATSFSWLVFDYGFLFDVLATALAIIAILLGGRNRRLGLIALAIVALAFGVMFIG